MKLVSVIYIIVLVACSGNSASKNSSQESQGLNINQEEINLNDQWPFENTLKRTDPYVSELLAVVN